MQNNIQQEHSFNHQRSYITSTEGIKKGEITEALIIEKLKKLFTGDKRSFITPFKIKHNKQKRILDFVGTKMHDDYVHNTITIYEIKYSENLCFYYHNVEQLLLYKKLLTECLNSKYTDIKCKLVVANLDNDNKNLHQTKVYNIDESYLNKDLYTSKYNRLVFNKLEGKNAR